VAAGLTIAVERRKTARIGPERTPWSELALLRPGQDVFVINVSSGGALLESHTRMSPGARTELQLSSGPARRRSVRGRIVRCGVSALDPLRYRGAIAFDEWLDVDGGTG
jgi:hypothetical protein